MSAGGAAPHATRRPAWHVHVTAAHSCPALQHVTSSLGEVQHRRGVLPAWALQTLVCDKGACAGVWGGGGEGEVLIGLDLHTCNLDLHTCRDVACAIN